MARARPRPDELLRRPQFFPVGILDAKSLTNRSLNEQNLAWQAANAERARRREFALRELGLETAHGALFSVLALGLTVPPDDLCGRAVGLGRFVSSSVTTAQARAALDDCFRRGLVQIVDDAALERIKTEVRELGLLGPVDGYPQVGGVDFTIAGGELFHRFVGLLSARPEPRWGTSGECVRYKSTFYYPTLAAAHLDVAEQKQWDMFFAATEPTPIGPWRAQWWRRFEQGYRVDFEFRAHWQGYGGMEGRHVRAYFLLRPEDRAQAARVAAREGVELFEWVAMMGLAESYGLSALAQGLEIELNESHRLRALHACRDRGWIRPRTESTIAEIRYLLDEDDALMPAPYEAWPSDTEFEFTDEGARRYCDLSAEILGPNWQDIVAVEVGTYREDHTYVTDKRESFNRDDFEEPPRAVREVAIGPWCSYWWDRYPSGYRIEKVYGEP